MQQKSRRGVNRLQHLLALLSSTSQLKSTTRASKRRTTVYEQANISGIVRKAISPWTDGDEHSFRTKVGPNCHRSVVYGLIDANQGAWQYLKVYCYNQISTCKTNKSFSTA